MKTIKHLRAKIAAMPREEIEQLVANIVIRLYGDVSRGNRRVLNPTREWDADTIDNIGDDVFKAKLTPDQL